MNNMIKAIENILQVSKDTRKQRTNKCAVSIYFQFEENHVIFNSCLMLNIYLY